MITDLFECDSLQVSNTIELLPLTSQSCYPEGLSNAALEGVDLSFATLSGIDLSGANLQNTRLIGADLRDANLTKANLNGAVLRGANLSGAQLAMSSFIGADLKGALVVDCSLDAANFSQADLQGVDFSGAYLVGVDFSDACLHNAFYSSETCFQRNFSPEAVEMRTDLQVPYSEIVVQLNRLADAARTYLGDVLTARYWETSRLDLDGLEGFEVEQKRAYIQWVDQNQQLPVGSWELQQVQNWVNRFIHQCSQVVRDFPSYLEEDAINYTLATL